jgi:hypothetical protein
MPFPADPGKDSRFIGRAGLELVHAMDGNRPFVTVTAAEPTKVGRQSGNPMPAPIQFPTNIELVTKYYDKIDATTIVVHDGSDSHPTSSAVRTISG